MLIETYKKDNILIEIIQDENPEDPRKFYENLGTMLTSHRRYALGDKQTEEAEEVEAAIKECIVYRNLYLLDHSGLTMRTTSFNDKWDSGQVGIIYVTRKAIKETFGEKARPRHAKLIEIIEAEVKTYNDYLTDNTYGYVIKELKTCNLGEQHETLLDSCYGFYGNHQESGLLDAIKGLGYDLDTMEHEVIA